MQKRGYLCSALLVGAAAVACVDAAGCPYMRGAQQQQQQQSLELSPEQHRELQATAGMMRPHGGRVPEGGFEAVEKDLEALMTDSQDFWPADFGNYGPFFIRLAWHCSGSYRISDGRGGCDGGRIRFSPELNWPDNANLNHALELLKPIKQKYGASLSWGDLIILAGNVAIKSMGGPILGFCGGRVDSFDGFESLPLGPTALQVDLMPCEDDGACEYPLGPTTLGLIYVNPQGPKGKPDPEASANDVRASFGSMDMNDSETVALVGGGHAFGKMHGACKTPPCGRAGPMQGKGENTVTSGFEGQWTLTPTIWTNDYFKNLLNFKWKVEEGPGGNMQWKQDPLVSESLTMLTADMAMVNDPSYLELSNLFAEDLDALNDEFSRAWYKLTSRDMGPAERCLGSQVPESQPYQLGLPQPPRRAKLPDFGSVKDDLVGMVEEDPATFVPAFVKLANLCASTYRDTDHMGGCNGARIRFQTEWPENRGAEEVLELLTPVKEEHAAVSWADLIVLAGQVATEHAGAPPSPFCGGRVDAEDAEGADFLRPRSYIADPIVAVKDDMQVMGFNVVGGVALFGRPDERQSDPSKVSNELFVNLITKDFVPHETRKGMYVATDDDKILITHREWALSQDSVLRDVVMSFAMDNDYFKMEFAKAWHQLMTADRFDGPLGNVCDGMGPVPLDPQVDDDAAEDDFKKDGSCSNGKQHFNVDFSKAEGGLEIPRGVIDRGVRFDGGVTFRARKHQDAAKGLKKYGHGLVMDSTSLLKDKTQGNILIISTHTKRPVINRQGGNFLASFEDGPVTLETLKLAGVMGHARLKLYGGTDGRTLLQKRFLPMQTTLVDVNTEGVTRFVLTLLGTGGGLSDVQFTGPCRISSE